MVLGITPQGHFLVVETLSPKQRSPMIKSKREMKAEIEQARRYFIAAGKRVNKLTPDEDVQIANAKPRKQRLKMFA